MRMLRVLTAATCLVSLTLALAPAAIVVAAAPRPAGTTFKAVPVKTGLNGPSGFTFGPSGNIWFLERGTGEVRILNRKTGATHRFFAISHVDGSGERGALGIALDPAFPTKPVVYVYVTRRWNGHIRNQLVRIRKVGRTGTDMKILLTIQGTAGSYHDGGRLLFGPGGKLYLIVGDAHDDANAQDLSDNLRGKILRLDRDGSGASGNPHGRIWSFGHRNSFGFTFDPKTGRLWETENGPSCNDEINLIAKDGNFGWGANQDCSTGSAPQNTNNSGPSPRRLPKTYFPSPIGITGAEFCVSCGLGAGVAGDLVFGDVNTSSIRAVNMNATRTGFSTAPRILLATGTGGVHSLEVGPKHRIYFSGPNGIYRLAAS
jgi:glucose/arabinose dehydrogenase